MPNHLLFYSDNFNAFHFLKISIKFKLFSDQYKTCNINCLNESNHYWKYFIIYFKYIILFNTVDHYI